ncbi:protein of unknown function (plasmid) [Methylocella tundrae]|uniref:Uncharacterized protein n=1 Tax=Methylocella tundrae TaxID=227605 RepID=A0A4U8Z884_METTU|nr:protein of unknown function [Methylocella tundrae]
MTGLGRRRSRDHAKEPLAVSFRQTETILASSAHLKAQPGKGKRNKEKGAAVVRSLVSASVTDPKRAWDNSGRSL